MSDTIDRKINPEIPIMQESNRNEVYIPSASYTEPGVAGFYKTHFRIDDNGVVHLRKDPKRAVSAITYDSNTNTLKVTFDDGTIQYIKLNDYVCIDGSSLTVYDAYNVITFEKTSWNALDSGNALVISSAITGYSDSEIAVQLDKYKLVTTNVGDKSVTSEYQTDNEYQIYKCTDGSLVLFATQAFKGRFIILRRQYVSSGGSGNIGDIYGVQFPVSGADQVLCDGTNGITITGTLRIFTNEERTAMLDVPDSTVILPIVTAEDGIHINASIDQKKAVISMPGIKAQIDDIKAAMAKPVLVISKI